MAEINDGAAADPPGEYSPSVDGHSQGGMGFYPHSLRPLAATLPPNGMVTNVMTTGGTTLSYSNYRTVRIVLSQSLVAALVKHACSDSTLPVFGYLGGHANQTAVEVDAQGQRQEYLICQASDFRGKHATDDIPSETIGSLERATLLFRDRGLDCIGWYRSAPNTVEFQPTLEDIQQQRHMQRQYPWSVGALIIPPPFEDAGGLADVAPLINIFRVVPSFLTDQYDSAGNIVASPVPPAMDITGVISKVPFAFTSRIVSDPVLFRRQQHMLMNSLAESRKAHTLRLADNDHRRAISSIVDAEYDAFLTDFWKSNVVELSKSIEHDYRTLAVHKLQMKRQIADRIRSLACLRTKQQMVHTGCNNETDQLANSVALNMQHISHLLGVLTSSMKSANNNLNLLPADITKPASYQWYSNTDKSTLPVESLTNKHDNSNGGSDTNNNPNGTRKVRQHRSRKSANTDSNSKQPIKPVSSRRSKSVNQKQTFEMVDYEPSLKLLKDNVSRRLSTPSLVTLVENHHPQTSAAISWMLLLLLLTVKVAPIISTKQGEENFVNHHPHHHPHHLQQQQPILEPSTPLSSSNELGFAIRSGRAGPPVT
ncbi:hypothetical protein BDF22DRAFT_740791 [Syncephalis plumigaleata]|nr:hypothetical protein BDF22DRAFT_740791 [Syncephalis plumigaleata]